MDSSFHKIISLENLFLAWKEFRCDKRKKHDVQIFERNLEDNLFSLREALKSKKYRHSAYSSFYINDPKSRNIQKADVRDRVLHHAIYRILYPILDRTFISDSYSCRLKKGTHRAVLRLEKFVRKVSRNYMSPCFALKCDIKQFFASVDHEILKEILSKEIKDPDTLWLLDEIISSFPPDSTAAPFERESTSSSGKNRFLAAREYQLEI